MTGSEEAGDYSQEPNKLMGSHDLPSVQRELGSHFKGTVHPPPPIKNRYFHPSRLLRCELNVVELDGTWLMVLKSI